MSSSTRLAAGIVLLLAVGCGPQTSSVPVATRASTVPARVEDCRGVTETGPNAPSPPAGVEFRSLTVDGKLRDYRLFLPPQIDGTKPVPLVVVLHGSPIDAAGFETVIHFDQQAAHSRLLTVSPNGCGGFWSYSEGGSKVADEDFIRKVIHDAEAGLSISKVFVMGASAGSKMAYRLACDLASEITAIASVAGTMDLSDSCSPARPVSILEIHGTADTVLAWEGGGERGGAPVEDVSRRWRQLDGCVGDPVVTQTGSTVTSLWNHCQAGAHVRLDKVVGGRHTWFNSPATGEPDANSVISSFFSSLSG